MKPPSPAPRPHRATARAVDSRPAGSAGPFDGERPNLALPLHRLLGHTADVVAQVLAGHSLTEALLACPLPARPGSQALSFHVLRCLAGAQAANAHLVSRKPPAPIQPLLLCALALLWPRERELYAAHTLVDQAVACARARVPASASFVNAVLRRFLRERDELVARWEAADPVVRYQHPRWWIDLVRHDWPQQWPSLLDAANRHAPMVLRVNARQVDTATYCDELLAVGIEAHGVSAQGVVLARPSPVQALPGFESGRVSVQDVSAQVAAPLLLGEGADRLAAGAYVLDACAAPGGKTAHLLELADLDLLALDVDAQRLARVDQTLQRIGRVASLRVGDAGDPNAWWDGRAFDAILLDAPCSASGIVRRHPDVRWLRRATDIATLARTQARLLDALWPLLKPGGRLVYATCSIFHAEGADQIAAFLQRTPDAIWRAAPGHLLGVADNPAQAGDVANAAGDGFFYARLDKST